MLTTHKPPILAFVGFSGSGKTTLLEKIITLLKGQNKNIALIKHAHHDFDIDIPGKDSFRLRHAGATQVLIASRKRRAHITETPALQADPDLASCIADLDSTQLDLILIEGFKHALVNKIEINRTTTGQPYLYPQDDNIIALVTDNTDVMTAQDITARNITVFDINQPDAIVDFILEYIDNTH